MVAARDLSPPVAIQICHPQIMTTSTKSIPTPYPCATPREFGYNMVCMRFAQPEGAFVSLSFPRLTFARLSYFCLFIALTCALLLSACSPAATGVALQAQAVTAVPGTPIATLPANTEGASIVARVNGVDITLETFNRALSRAEQQQLSPVDATTLQNEVLSTLIQQSVIEQAATQAQLTVSDEELNAEVQTAIEIAGSPEAWQTWLQSNLYTEDEFRATLRDALLTTRLRDSITAQVTETTTSPYIHARHILVSTETEANAVLARLQNGEDFATIAGEVSRDETTRRTGGDLGWFSLTDLLQPTLAIRAAALSPNMIAGPIQTELGYHILQTLEKQERESTETDRQLLAQQYFEVWLATQMQNAVVERFM